MAWHIALPSCGMFIGTGVYPMSKDYLLSALYAHPTWTPEDYHPLDMIERVLADNQGNLIQLWGQPRGYAPWVYAEWFYALDEIGLTIPPPDWEHGKNLRPQDSLELQRHADRNGAGIVRFIRAAAEKGLYTVLLYVEARPEWARLFHEAGHGYYLGYDFGERFTFRLENALAKNRGEGVISLQSLADDFVRRVREHVEERKANGWGPIMATSLNFYVDYEILAGTDIPVLEDFAFSHLNMASALSRGLYRQFDLPLWGSHLAHEHYSWIPIRHPHKFELLRAALFQKYLAGCKMVINESGQWFVEATLCEDSPKFEAPELPLTPGEVSWGGDRPIRFGPYIEAARHHYPRIGYSSEVCRTYRKVISDFYDFVLRHGTPKGQPETPLALAKGNLDFCGHRYSPNAAIGGLYDLAEQDPRWFEGAPERGWEIAKRVFYPLPPILEPHPNRFLSGTPFGPVDVVSFADDRISSDFLKRQYRALLFCGWNTASPWQYDILLDYVFSGGILFISIPHLSMDTTRNYGAFGVADLVHRGDFSALCGVRVKGRGIRYYWATAIKGRNDLGFRYPRRFGIMTTCLGDIEVTDSSAEPLVVEDEGGYPLLLRRRCGQGEVYFLNSWAYPGALDQDEGPGATTDSPGLIGFIYRHLAMKVRGTVWISDDGREPGNECRFIAFSYFPEDGSRCFQNVDFERSHRFYCHEGQVTRCVELLPGEFRLLNPSEGKDIRC